MSKYERLVDNNNVSSAAITTAATATATTTMTATADDDSCMMFIGHNHSNGNSSSNSNNYSRMAHNMNNGITVDADESTVDVPLLTSNNNNNDQDYDLHHRNHNHHQQHACRCEQPGFSANLTNKSTHEAKIKILLAISLCGIFMIIEFLGGYVAGSLAIMTDAAHLASDCISFVIGLLAIWLGSRPPDSRMSFGYKRTEVLGAIISILGIWILTATLVIVAIQRLYSNDFDLDANTMMIISGIGILINIVMAYILHGSSLLPNGAHGHSHGHGHDHGHGHGHSHAHSQASTFSRTHAPQMDNASMLVDGSASLGNGLKHTNESCHSEKNLNLRAAMIHVIGDLVQSIGVFLASVLIKFFPNAKFADPLCTLLFSIIVILTTVGLFKESVGILMDAVPLEVSMESLEMDLSHIDGVKSVHHLNVWSHTANHSVMMAHLVIDLLADSNTVLAKATTLAHSNKYNIKHSAIQIERVTS